MDNEIKDNSFYIRDALREASEKIAESGAEALVCCWIDKEGKFHQASHAPNMGDHSVLMGVLNEFYSIRIANKYIPGQSRGGEWVSTLKDPGRVIYRD